MEDIFTFGLLECVRMPPYKTIGVFDSVKASNIGKFRSVCQRERLLKFSIDTVGETPLIKAIGSSKVDFVREILKEKQPINHRDNVTFG